MESGDYAWQKSSWNIYHSKETLYKKQWKSVFIKIVGWSFNSMQDMWDRGPGQPHSTIGMPLQINPNSAET